MRRSTYQLIGVATLLIAVSAATEEVTALDRFRLWNDCAPVDLEVDLEHLGKDGAVIGLTEEAIATAVRSRLRASRLYDADKSEFLYVNVGVMGSAFTIKLSFNKPLHDAASDITVLATSWNSSSLGTGRDSGFILSSVSQHTDQFIDEYLRVNEDACSRGP